MRERVGNITQTQRRGNEKWNMEYAKTSVVGLQVALERCPEMETIEAWESQNISRIISATAFFVKF